MQEAESPVLRRLMGSLVQLLPELSTVDEHDVRLQGKLELLLSLIIAFNSHGLPSHESQQLVHLLLTGDLPPACVE